MTRSFHREFKQRKGLKFHQGAIWSWTLRQNEKLCKCAKDHQWGPHYPIEMKHTTRNGESSPHPKKKLCNCFPNFLSKARHRNVWWMEVCQNIRPWSWVVSINSLLGTNISFFLRLFWRFAFSQVGYVLNHISSLEATFSSLFSPCSTRVSVPASNNWQLQHVLSNQKIDSPQGCSAVASQDTNIPVQTNKCPHVPWRVPSLQARKSMFTGGV